MVTVAAPDALPSPTHGVEARISNDPGAPGFVPLNAETIWPWRQKNFLKVVNRSLAGVVVVNGHDILCINRKYKILKTRSDFAYKPHTLASPQYNQAYADWIVQQVRDDAGFLKECRKENRDRSAAASPAGPKR